MSLQARLTLWSILLTAIVVGLVSFIDLTSEINRQFFSTQNDAELIRRLAEEFTRHSIDRNAGAPSARAAVSNDSAWLSGQLLSLMRVMKPVSDISVCDDAGSRILADSHLEHIGQPCPSAPVWSQVMERASWFNRMMLLWRDENSYELSGEISGMRATDPPLTVRVILQPRIIRAEMSEVLRRHFGISAIAVVVIMFVAFILSSIALQPLGRLGRLVDNISRGEFELSGDSGKREAQDEFNVVASKVSLLGQQLQGAKTEFSDLKTNVERLLEELEDAVLIFGRDRRLIAAAGAVERLLGTPKAALLNKTITDVFPAGTSLALFLAQALQTGRTIRNRRVPLSGSADGNGNPQFALLTVEFLDPGGPGGMLIRLRDPEATRAIGRRLQTADRLSAISSLTKGVAHEVKNPLNAILMHVELARYKLSHGDYDLEPQMDVISTEIVRLDRVVKTFLDFTRPVQLNVSEVKLREFMEEIAALARPQAEAAGIQIVEKTEVEDAVIAADVDLLKQAVLNIVVNAIEAMPNGGTLSLEAGFRGDDAEIRISDTGPGIPADVRERIYDLYFTTKQHGSGIGLAMTYRILQLHDGTIDFTSGPEQGTTFSLRLPMSMLPAAV